MVAPDFFFSEELLFFVHIRRLEKSFRKMVCSATVWSRYKSSFNLSWSVEIVGFLLCLVPISCLVGLFLMLFWFSLSPLTMGSLICYWYWLLLIHLFSAHTFILLVFENFQFFLLSVFCSTDLSVVRFEIFNGALLWWVLLGCFSWNWSIYLTIWIWEIFKGVCHLPPFPPLPPLHMVHTHCKLIQNSG